MQIYFKFKQNNIMIIIIIETIIIIKFIQIKLEYNNNNI